MFGLVNPYRQATDSWAVFTQESYKLTDKLTATGGFALFSGQKVWTSPPTGQQTIRQVIRRRTYLTSFRHSHVVTRQG